jgi:hypothetical protein
MASTIAAVTTGGGGVVTTADASGNLSLLSGVNTVVAVTSAGVAVTGTLSATGAVTLTTALPVLSGGTGVTTSTGTGAVVLGTSPTITGTGSILASSIGGNVTQSNIVTSGVVGSTTAGTYTDTGASLSLVAGTYLITTIAPLNLTGQSGTNIAFRFGKLVLTDNSNTVVGAMWGGASTNAGVYPVVLSFALTVTSTTTYKTRFTTLINSGSPTVSSFELYVSSGELVSHNIIATRLT